MILSAKRTFGRITAPRGRTIPQRNGLAFERKFVQRLHHSAPKNFRIEHNPWFDYQDSGSGDSKICCPDILIYDDEFGYVIVTEVKLTWTPVAFTKLKNIYCPVVGKALGLPTKPLVVCKTLIPESPRPQSTMSFAFMAQNPLYQWLGTEDIRW